MEIRKTEIVDVFLLRPKVFGDQRGWFMESWSERQLAEAGLHYHFVQDNHSFSAAQGTLRGLHFQLGDAAQAKLVRCAKGAVLDVAVDLRIGSPSYRKFVTAELTADNKYQLLIPRGCAHGFLTLTDDVEFLYKADNDYDLQSERGIRWNDPVLSVQWGIDQPILSEKDAKAPFFSESEGYFAYEVKK